MTANVYMVAGTVLSFHLLLDGLLSLHMLSDAWRLWGTERKQCTHIQWGTEPGPNQRTDTKSHCHCPSVFKCCPPFALDFCSTSSSTFPKLGGKENIGSLAELLLFKIMIHFPFPSHCFKATESIISLPYMPVNEQNCNICGFKLQDGPVAHK